MKKISVLAILALVFAHYQPALAAQASTSSDFWNEIVSSTVTSTIGVGIDCNQSLPLGATTTTDATGTKFCAPTVSTTALVTEETTSTPFTVADKLIAEPTIRVKLAQEKNPILFVSSSTYKLFAGKTERATIEPNQEIKLFYQNGRYFVGGELTFDTGEPIRLVPENSDSVFILPRLKRTMSGHKGINYNAYRGTFEYRYSKKNKISYLINELPMEEYLKGLTETAPRDPDEYVKAVVVAARSYAFNHLGPNNESRLFDVYASTNDQLYLGYYSELRLPEVARLAEETSGQFVVYKGKVAVTVYSGRTSGATKNWKNLKDRPYLKSVVAKYDKGFRSNGHGYGMSMHDAKLRVTKDGWTYDQVLKYYYTGTTIEKIY